MFLIALGIREVGGGGGGGGGGGEVLTDSTPLNSIQR